ncbi:MAG: TetR/AcrR family transcriptional regulator [Gammaproteobacteria bacterium]
MPRIEAESIEAHVESQTQRILDSAMELFTARGYAGTELRDIAESVGLARNSLYRYYPSKDHILLACLRREMVPALERVKGLEESVPDARERINVWLDVQLDIAATACEGAMKMFESLQFHSPEFVDEIRSLHEPSAVTLQRAVSQVLKDSGRDVALISSLINSLLRTAAAAMIDGGNRDAISGELQKAVGGLLQH